MRHLTPPGLFPVRADRWWTAAWTIAPLAASGLVVLTLIQVPVAAFCAFAASMAVLPVAITTLVVRWRRWRDLAVSGVLIHRMAGVAVGVARVGPRVTIHHGTA